MTGQIEGQWYSYRVRAFNKLGASRPCRATDDIQAVDARGILCPSALRQEEKRIMRCDDFLRDVLALTLI